MFTKSVLLISAVLLYVSYLPLSRAQVKNDIKVTKFDCIIDGKILSSANCTLKAVRGKGNLLYASVLLARKIYSATLHASVFQWKNGYLPFLIDMEIDYCKLMSKNNVNQVQRLIRNIIASHSNMNHPCPYEGYLLATGVQPSIGMIPSLLVTGKYRLMLNFSTEGVWAGYCDIHCTISSELNY